MFYDPTFILIIPAFILALYAQFKVKSTYQKYSEVKASSGYTASAVARTLLDGSGLSAVEIDMVPGNLTDHYDPRTKKLSLSEAVYDSDSVAAIGVVAHEVGHAVQDQKAYVPLAFRNNFVPAANLGSTLAIPLFFVGLIMSFGPLMDLGIIFFSLAVAFHLITLPVEFNASRRAIVLLRSGNYLTTQELAMSKKVLDAAALTYVAATAMAVLQLIRLIALRGSRDD